MIETLMKLSWLNISNVAVLVLGAFTVIASTSVYVLSEAKSREADRALEQYKSKSATEIAQANRAAAEARAEAERAKLETVEVSERLALTQQRLDQANHITPLSDAQVDQIVKGLIRLPLGNTQPMWAAANDLQAQRRLLQLTTAAINADRRFYLYQTTGFFVQPAGEVGDVLVHYWADDQRVVADAVVGIFRTAGLVANTYKLPPEADDEARRATQNMVLVGLAARKIPKYGGHAE